MFKFYREGLTHKAEDLLCRAFQEALCILPFPRQEDFCLLQGKLVASGYKMPPRSLALLEEWRGAPLGPRRPGRVDLRARRSVVRGEQGIERRQRPVQGGARVRALFVLSFIEEDDDI